MVPKSIQILVFLSSLSLAGITRVPAQTTTWNNKHLFLGDVNVGVSGTTGHLVITGSTGNSAPPGLKVTGDGGVVFTGSHGVGALSFTGSGSRLMWHGKKSALRAGLIYGNRWDEASIGNYSVALGWNPRASGDCAVSLGGYTEALSYCCVAIGAGAYASGNAAVAIGDYTDSLNRASVALGWGTIASGVASTSTGYVSSADGDYSFAGGIGCEASGDMAFAFGSDALATGNSSVAFGSDAYAYGDGSVAMGVASYSGGEGSVAMGSSVAEGNYSFAFGPGVTTLAYGSAAFGYHNVGGGDPDDIVAEDPLFEIGNGTGNPSDPPNVEKRNAFTVYKNGNVIIPKRQGDILMGEFGNPE